MTESNLIKICLTKCKGKPTSEIKILCGDKHYKNREGICYWYEVMQNDIKKMREGRNDLTFPQIKDYCCLEVKG